MKKVWLVLLGIIFIMSSAATSQAADISGRFGVGFDVGVNLPSDHDQDDNIYLGGNLSYAFNRYVMIGCEAGYAKWDEDAAGADYGELRAVPVLGDLYVRHPFDIEDKGYTFAPYVVGGVGAIFWDFDEGAFLEAAGVSVDMDTELALKAGVGFDFFFSENTAINMEGGYMWSDAEVQVQAIGARAAEEIDTEWWTIKGGFKYFF
jgi:outer membrane protein W